MSFECVGFKEVSYTSKKTGSPVHGFTFFCEATGMKGVSGIYTESVYIPDNKLDCDPANLLGKMIRPLYNRYGNVETIEVLD